MDRPICMTLSYCPLCALRLRTDLNLSHPGVDPKHQLHSFYIHTLKQLTQSVETWRLNDYCFAVNHQFLIMGDVQNVVIQ